MCRTSPGTRGSEEDAPLLPPQPGPQCHLRCCGVPRRRAPRNTASITAAGRSAPWRSCRSTGGPSPGADAPRWRVVLCHPPLPKLAIPGAFAGRQSFGRGSLRLRRVAHCPSAEACAGWVNLPDSTAFRWPRETTHVTLGIRLHYGDVCGGNQSSPGWTLSEDPGGPHRHGRCTEEIRSPDRPGSQWRDRKVHEQRAASARGHGVCSCEVL